MVTNYTAKSIRVVGDIHGKYEEYFNLTHNVSHSVQLGDCGFDYSPLYGIDSDCHKFFFGNHDSRDAFLTPHFLGYFGYTELNGIKFFYVSGGASIDREYRLKYYHQTGKKIWWEDEELSTREMFNAYKWYSSIEPDFVISHEAPTVVMEKIQDIAILKSWGFAEDWRSSTQELLQNMYEVWQPKLWVHGHMHKAAKNQLGKTLFISLDELGYVDVNEDLEVEN